MKRISYCLFLNEKYIKRTNNIALRNTNSGLINGSIVKIGNDNIFSGEGFLNKKSTVVIVKIKRPVSKPLKNCSNINKKKTAIIMIKIVERLSNLTFWA